VSDAKRQVFLIGLALAIVGSALFSGKAIVVKLAYRYGVDATTLIALRMLFSAPFFAVVYLWTAGKAAPMSRGDHLRLIAIGLLGYYAASYLSFLGLMYVSAALERLILYLTPTLVLLFSVLFLSKRLQRVDLVALSLAYGGIVLVFWHDLRLEGRGILMGSALVFGSAICYASYLVMSGELVRRIGAIRLTAYASIVSTVAVLIQFAALNPLASLVQPAEVYWLSLVNGLFCTVLPMFATMMAVERIGAGSTSLAGMVGPVVTIALAHVFLGEPVSGSQLAGTALVLAGIFVLSRKSGAISK
jgi:drug/metabolite transporter (DMT)-like permease